MDLPVNPPVAPMLARAVAAVPAQPDDGPAWSYEPKWDGFRALVFRDGDEVALASRSGKDLARYFPELVGAARAALPARVVLDGEIAVPQRLPAGPDPVAEPADGWRLDWDALSARIHPAASRVAALAEQTPALFIGFDALALGDADLTGEPYPVRRAALREATGDDPLLRVTRATTDQELEQEWFTAFEGAGLDGIVAKGLAAPYVPGRRDMRKIKHKRTADCVVLGYRVHKSGAGLGSMLLGLYAAAGPDDGDGEPRMVGGASAFSDTERLELQQRFEAMRVDPDAVAQGQANRWRSSASGEWIPIRPELVAEVAYDQMEKGRFRHTVTFLRWRPDRDPRSCTYDQLEVPAAYDVYDVLEGD